MKSTDFAWSDIELFCKTCNQLENVVLRQNGPHIEARCSECLSYIKNIKQKHNDPGQGNICPPSTMSQGLYGSICIEDLFGPHIAKDGNGRSWVCLDNLLQKPFEQSQKNGKHYAGVSVWINDDYDQFQNIGSIILSQTKEEAAARVPKVYLGNLKYIPNYGPAAAPAPAGGYPPPAAQGFAHPNTYQQPAPQPQGQYVPPQQNWAQPAPQQQPQQSYPATVQQYPALPTVPYPPQHQPAQPMGQPGAGSYGQPPIQGQPAGPGQYGQGPGPAGSQNTGTPAQGQIAARPGDLPF